MKRYRAVVAIISALPFAVTIAASPVLAAGDPAAGKPVYVKKCQACHGPNGEKTKFGATTYAALNSKDVQSRSDEDLKKQSVYGVTGKMPKTPVPDADMDNLIAYMRTFKQ